MVHYLIEFRFSGYAKKYAKKMIYDVAREFKVRGVTRKRAVPHISLYGPFTTRQEKKMVSEIVEVGKKYRLVPFKVSGFNKFDRTLGVLPRLSNKVVYLEIEPSKSLENLRWDISKNLSKISNTKSKYDKKRKFHFHTTIAFRDIDKKFDDIWDYIKSHEEPRIKQHLLRITILKGGKILYEYDLLQQRLLNRKQSKSRYYRKKTLDILKSKT